MTILIVGDANADVSAALAHFPSEGDDSPVSALSWGSGGSAANVAAGLALLGMPARLFARVGCDPAAEIALRVARAAGVDLAAVQRDDNLATGLCYAAVSPGGERTFFSYRGANVALEVDTHDGALFENVRWLHVAGHALLEGPQRAAALTLIDAAERQGVPISLDLCLPLLRVWRTQTSELLPRLQIVFANERELGALVPDLATPLDPVALLEQYERLASIGPRLVVVKLGPRGCVCIGAQPQSSPAFAVDAVDSNGCGDAFAAGFLYGYLQEANLEVCATLANALGALTATRVGAAEALPDRKRLRAFLGPYADCRAVLQLIDNT